MLLAATFSGHGAHGVAAAHAAATALRKFLTEHHQWLLTAPQEALANGCRIANAAVRAAVLRAEPAARLCRGEGGYVPMLHLGGGRYRADTSGSTMALAAVLGGDRLVFASLGDSPVLLVGRDEAGATRCARLLAEHTPTNAAEARRVGATPHGRAVRFVYMGTAGSGDEDIFARDAAGAPLGLDRAQARAAQARRATPVLLIPEAPLTLEDDGAASEQADMRLLWHGVPPRAARDGPSARSPRGARGRVVEEARAASAAPPAPRPP